MKKKKKLLFALFTNNWLGVSETFIFRQASSLITYGDVFVLTQNRKRSKILEDKDFQPDVYLAERSKKSLMQGIVKRKLRLGGNLYRGSKPQEAYWEEVLKNRRPDIVHAHYGTGGLAILDLTRKLSIPQVTTFHGNDASVLVKKKAYVDSLQLMFAESYIITVSNFIRKRLISLGASSDKIYCHYIGTDLSRFQFTPRSKAYKQKIVDNEKVSFLQVSNFVEKKGHYFTIQAFSRYLQYYSNAELILAGDGETKSEIEELVKKMGVESKVKFLGAIGPVEVSDLMKTCDIFLHHSITGTNGSEEGIPTVIMEAMAVGIPVVTTYHAGIPELVVPEECGILVPEKSIEKYSTALKALEGMDISKMAENAYEKVRADFDIHKQNKLLFSLYEKILANYHKKEK